MTLFPVPDVDQKAFHSDYVALPNPEKDFSDALIGRHKRQVAD